MDTDETKNQVTPANFETSESHNQVVEVKTNNPMVNQCVMADSSIEVESVNNKILYEKCLAELKAQTENIKIEISKIKKECGHDIIKIKKKFKKRELALKKEIKAQKKRYDENMKEMKTFHSNNMTILKEKIKLLDAEDASFKPLSDAIFNCISIEEIFKIKRLLKQHRIEEVLEKHLETLQALFLSLSYGVIPICQPQRDVVTDYQRNLIEMIE